MTPLNCPYLLYSVRSSSILFALVCAKLRVSTAARFIATSKSASFANSLTLFPISFLIHQSLQKRANKHTLQATVSSSVGKRFVMSRANGNVAPPVTEVDGHGRLQVSCVPRIYPASLTS